jgi:thiamine pyrophosphokinase
MEEVFLSKRTHAIIFANGRIKDLESVARLIHSMDLIVAADGGARHCQKLGLTPDVLIGDFDSLDQADLYEFERSGVQIIRHPVRKDYTDLELALLHVKSIGVTSTYIFGALGLRWDQTMANLLLPASSNLSDIKIQLFDGNQEITVIKAGDPYEISGNPGDTVSLISLKAETGGISTEGLEYSLKDESLAFGATRGVSNVLREKQATVRLSKGLLLCVVIHQS